MIWGKIAPAFSPTDVAFLLGGGPSLITGRLDEIVSCGRAVAVNESAFLPRPKFDAVVSIDHQFVTHRAGGLEVIAKNECPVYIVPPDHLAEEMSQRMPSVTFLREANAFSWGYGSLHRQGGSSGYAALNAAVLMGAKRIVLLGYDYKRDANRRKNWHNRYNWPQNENFGAWARKYDVVAQQLTVRSIEVINASPDSALLAFPRVSVDEMLNWKWREQVAA